VSIVTLLAYGCPPQASVAAFGLDLSAPSLAGSTKEHIVQAGEVPLAQVQADELRVRVVCGVVWRSVAGLGGFGE